MLANNLGVSHAYRDAISIPFRLHLSQLAGRGTGWSNLYKKGINRRALFIWIIHWWPLIHCSEKWANSLTCEKQYVMILSWPFSLETKHRPGNPIHQEFLMEIMNWPEHWKWMSVTQAVLCLSKTYRLSGWKKQEDMWYLMSQDAFP